MKKILITALLCAAGLWAEAEVVCTKVFSEDEVGSKYYRIPAVAVTNSGRIVALADKRGSSNSDLPNIISIVCKTSDDGGLTWSEARTIAQGVSSTETYGDPALAYDPESNTLLTVFIGDKGFWQGTNSDPCGLYYNRSYDEGETWTVPTAFQSQVYQDNWEGAFCASGSMLVSKYGDVLGRIYTVCNVNTKAGGTSTTNVKEYVLYTDDLGDTWRVANPDSAPNVDQGNESKLVELEDGSLLMSIRFPGCRKFSRSYDGGVTWSEPITAGGLVSADCNGAIISTVYDGQTVLLHSYPANSTTRRDLTVAVSMDNGYTWPWMQCLLPDLAAYSDLCVLKDGRIGLFVEDGRDHSVSGNYELSFMTFPIEYLFESEGRQESPGYLPLDGTQHMSIPVTPFLYELNARDVFSVSLKVRPTQLEIGTTPRLISALYYATAYKLLSGWEIYLSNKENEYQVVAAITYLEDTKSTTLQAIATSAEPILPLDKWSYIDLLYDCPAGVASLMVNGAVLAQTEAVPSGASVRTYFDPLVGAQWPYNYPITAYGYANYFTGDIDDVLISDSNITITDAQSYIDLYNDWMYYEFETISGLGVPDVSGNGYTASLVGYTPFYSNYSVLPVISVDSSSKVTSSSSRWYDLNGRPLTSKPLYSGFYIEVSPEGARKVCITQ